jgi:hypothetical protein
MRNQTILRDRKSWTFALIRSTKDASLGNVSTLTVFGKPDKPRFFGIRSPGEPRHSRAVPPVKDSSGQHPGKPRFVAFGDKEAGVSESCIKLVIQWTFQAGKTSFLLWAWFELMGKQVQRALNG